jgi:DNA polymerase elongation subunit (family B)
MKFESMSEARDFIKQYEGVENFGLYGFPRFEYVLLNELFPEEVVYDKDLISVCNFDIEVGSENGFPDPETASESVTAITVKLKNHYTVFGCGVYSTNRNDVTYIHCADEEELLQKFLVHWGSGGHPDILTGWNISFFDIPYLVRRIEKILGEGESKRLSPWGTVYERKTVIQGKGLLSYSIAGIANLDYLELYRKFTYSQQESYRLDHIAYVELGERKIDYSEYSSLHGLYRNDYQKFIDYNIKDVALVDQLEDKMKLIEMAITLAYDAKVNMQDVFTQVRMWDVLIHNHLWGKNIAVPVSGGGAKDSSYIGAYVKSPQIGMHKWVVSFDLNSLYPHLIMQYNISPEKLIIDKKTKTSVSDILNGKIPAQNGYSLTPNGCYFNNDSQGFLPEMMERMYNDRVVYKNRMIDAQKAYEKEKDVEKKIQYSKDISRYKNMQLARKVQLNSAYGAIGNPYFRFFNLDQATAITTGGQLAIRWIEKSLNKYMNKILETKNVDFVIASDTDSVYITFDMLVNKVFKKGTENSKIISFLDKVAKEKLEPFIDKSYSELAILVNAFDQKMSMKREVIADKGIWTAKKRYILNVHDSEGVRYEKPKLKIMGIEAVKSSTPSSCREAIRESLNLIMNTNETILQEYIQEFRGLFEKLPFEDVAFPRGVSKLYKYIEQPKSIPIHVRGALVYNNALEEYNLKRKYETIKEGEKIKFCYMKLPNPIKSNVISISSTLPSEFELEPYIDYNKQFDKAFLEPLRSVLGSIQWNEEKINTIEDFF